MTTFNLEGLPPEYMLRELYNIAQPQGMGWFAAINAPESIDVDKAREWLKQATVRGQASFDYICGRPIKVTFTADGLVLRTDLFDRDAWPGATQTAYERALEAYTGGK